MNSDPQEGHPNENLLCHSHPVAYGWSWDFQSGRRVTYDTSKGFLEVYYTDKGNPLEGYPKEMDEAGLEQLLRAVLQLEGTMSKKMLGEIRDIFVELDALVQEGMLAVDNTRGKEISDDALDVVRAKARRLNELLSIMEPRLPELLPKKKRDELASLPKSKSVAVQTTTERKADVKPDLDWGAWARKMI